MTTRRPPRKPCSIGPSEFLAFEEPSDGQRTRRVRDWTANSRDRSPNRLNQRQLDLNWLPASGNRQDNPEEPGMEAGLCWGSS